MGAHNVLLTSQWTLSIHVAVHLKASDINASQPQQILQVPESLVASFFTVKRISNRMQQASEGVDQLSQAGK